MFTRSKLLLLTTLTLCILAFAIGCDQPDDVITFESSAFLTLSPERLPNNPAGTVYELWVANNTDTLSLGKFGYNYDDRNFLTEIGLDRPDKGTFFMDVNIDNYNNILVSVEPTINDDDASPASIMLFDFTSSPTIKLVLPLVDSLWSSTIRYNMKSTSDGSDTANDGQSIWFSNYRQTTETIVDTTSIVEWHLDSGTYVPPDTIVHDTSVIGIDSIISVIVQEPLGLDDGIDSVGRAAIRFDSIISIDSTDYYPTTLRVTYTFSEYDVTVERFTQDDFEIPSLEQYGWKYRGWVISDVITPSAVGNITLPAWTLSPSILTNVEGGLLSTGSFYNIALPDMENLYVDTNFRNPPRVPQFPGEDFLENLPTPLVSIPNLAGTAGHVFVTLEPVFYSDSTNFPIIAFFGDLPIKADTVFTSAAQGFTLFGYMYTNDPFRGAPSINVTIEKL